MIAVNCYTYKHTYTHTHTCTHTLLVYFSKPCKHQQWSFMSTQKEENFIPDVLNNHIPQQMQKIIQVQGSNVIHYC